MTSDPRAALDRLTAAFEAHLNAAAARHGDDDPAVDAAYATLADAFEHYDEALYTAHQEATPFVLYDDLEEIDDEIEGDDGSDDDDEDDDLDDDGDDLDDHINDEDLA